MWTTPNSSSRRPLSELTPSPLQRRPLSELTPSPLQPVRSVAQAARSPAAGAGGDSPFKALNIQRFSLRSRRSAPYETKRRPGVACLKTLTCIPATQVNRVNLCPCSWAPALKCGEVRQCRHDTDEHDEYRLLQDMSRRYADERGSSIVASDSLPKAAALGDLEVYFILAAAVASPVFFDEPSEDTVVGYVALRRELPHMCAEDTEDGAAVMLVQVYVEPECRSRGYATSAMRVLLAKSSVVAMARPVPLMCRMLSRLGFTDGSDFVTEESGNDEELGNALPCTFYRTIPCTE